MSDVKTTSGWAHGAGGRAALSWLIHGEEVWDVLFSRSKYMSVEENRCDETQ